MTARKAPGPRLYEATATAPACVGNVAVGFDLLGFAIEGCSDRVTARRCDQSGVRIASIEGRVTELPRDTLANTASRAVDALLSACQPDLGIELSLYKGIPLGSGLGGSAASATAAVVAANALLERPLPQAALYPYAMQGEAAATDALVGDNVGPQLLGGLVMALPDRLLSLPVPDNLYAAVVHPDYVVETRQARAVLGPPFSLDEVLRQQANLSQVLMGLYQSDFDLIRAGLQDVMIEPRRASLVPGFAAVQQAALDEGALGASLSGAGPSLFAWCIGQAQAEAVASAMVAAFAKHGLSAQAWVSSVQGPSASLYPSATPHD